MGTSQMWRVVVKLNWIKLDDQMFDPLKSQPKYSNNWKAEVRISSTWKVDHFRLNGIYMDLYGIYWD